MWLARVHGVQFAIHAKGRVENSIGYIQKNFLKDLQISSLEALNAQVAVGWSRWLTSGFIARGANDPATPSKRKSQPFSLCRWPATILA
jgi:hypothetical protein